MAQEKLLEKIKKLFELASNNPSKEEAESAALKAQELLNKHHLDYAQINGISFDKIDPIGKVGIGVTTKKWKYMLAEICSNNYRVTHFWSRCGKEEKLVFYGHKTDVMIAAETFQYLYKMGDTLAKKLYREAKAAGELTENIYDSCVIGFCVGIKEALAEQSKALMVVVPDDVKEKYAEMTKGFSNRTVRPPKVYRAKAFNEGREHGYNAMRQKALEG